MNDAGTAILALCGPSLVLIAVLSLVVVLWNRDRRALATARAERDRLAEELPPLRQENADYQRLVWLRSLSAVTYRNEVEVEAKFIAPLVAHLGFAPSQVDLRVPVAVQVGRDNRNGVADWLLWSPDHSKVVAVVEAKRPQDTLNGRVQGQARSYAFALGAPMFLIANGYRLQIYRRGVEADQCLVDCKVADLVDQWPIISAAINPNGGHHA